MRLLSLALLLFATAASGQTRYEWAGGNGNWNEATNWSPIGVPGTADTAVMSGFLLVTLGANTTVAGLEMSSGSAIGGDFDLTVTHQFVWDGGSVEGFRGTGMVTVTSGATLQMVDPASGGGQFSLGAGRTMINNGTIHWESSNRFGGTGAIINNGEILLAMGQSDAFGVIFASRPDILTNTASGVIRRNGTGSALLNSGFVNDGLIRVEAGTLQLGGFNSNGGRGTGSIEIDPGAELYVSGGVHLQRSVTGARLVVSSNPRMEVSDAYDVTTTRITGGVLQINTGGETETLQIEGGSVEGPGDLTVTGTLDWTGGVMGGSGTTTLGPAIPITIGGGNVALRDTRTLRVQGTTTWTGEANLSGGTGATFENEGILMSSGAGERLFFGPVFENTGTLIHDGGLLDFNAPMNNTGTIRIESGTLEQQGFNSTGGTDSGRYVVASGASLLFNGGNRTLTESAEIIGTGTVAFNGGNVTNRGLWRPGASPGILTISTDWPAPAPEAVLDMEVGGPTPGTEHDQVAVNGSASLGGTIRVTLTDGFVPSDGDRFLLIAASGGATGAFDTVEIPSSPAGYVQATTQGVFYGIGTPVAGDEAPSLPSALALHAPAPNPARGPVTLAYDLPLASSVRLAVYDALGRQVAVLVNAERPAGTHSASLDARGLPSGLYFVRLDASGKRATQMLTVVR